MLGGIDFLSWVMSAIFFTSHRDAQGKTLTHHSRIVMGSSQREGERGDKIGVSVPYAVMRFFIRRQVDERCTYKV